MSQYQQNILVSAERNGGTHGELATEVNKHIGLFPIHIFIFIFNHASEQERRMFCKHFGRLFPGFAIAVCVEDVLFGD